MRIVDPLALCLQVLHLTCLALYEEKRRRVINGGDEFKFITAATATDGMLTQ